jgi:SPP1 family predicted phage head-tail adaptor
VTNEFAGTLRERVLIERPISVRNEMGLQEPGWEEVCRCLASVVLESVGAESEAQALSAMPRYRVTIRRRDGIAIDQRVNWNERKLMIRQLLDDPREKDRLTLRCEEVRG